MLSAAMNIAAQWGQVLGPEKLDIALKGLEPQLKREHLLRVRQLDMKMASEERAACEKREERAHRRHMADLMAGTVVSIAMLGAGVFVATTSWWLSVMLCGPSLLALAKIFVLRRSDAGDMKAVAMAGQTSVNAASQAQRSPEPPPP
ncbi:hypothetical protein [Kitasatospora sp. NPDC088779]|uniref:hypothetical protein n=1 Tax=Kitasatospora sp. NPDC088779 TaxID=3154964 RepID=UPI0034375229